MPGDCIAIAAIQAVIGRRDALLPVVEGAERRVILGKWAMCLPRLTWSARSASSARKQAAFVGRQNGG